MCYTSRTYSEETDGLFASVVRCMEIIMEIIKTSDVKCAYLGSCSKLSAR